jgi:putative transposase
MPRFPHHITQRGNWRADVFDDDVDREAYLRFLRKYGDRYGLSVWAYCLMSNHIHLVVVPVQEESLGRALRDAHTVYAMHFNQRTNRPAVREVAWPGNHATTRRPGGRNVQRFPCRGYLPET